MRPLQLSGVVIALFLCAGALKDDAKSIVEHSKPIAARDDVLGTNLYQPTTTEAKLAKTWDEKEEVPYSSKPDKLSDSAGQWIGWFGIVRDVNENRRKSETALLVEAKHFDGLVDLHQQIVSIFGAGDFRVVIQGVGHKIKPLSLVRVCGNVNEVDGKDPKKEDPGVPTIKAAYVRVWDWGDFAFMAYGTDSSNPKWIALRKIAAEKMYASRPDHTYYEERLGKR